MVVADDCGLVVHALGGRPGVFSSRYAGPDATYADNCRRLLDELEGATTARAAFVCVLVGLDAPAECLVAVRHLPRPDRAGPARRARLRLRPGLRARGRRRSMAEMTRDEKAAISHRGRAARRLAAVLGPPSPTG